MNTITLELNKRQLQLLDSLYSDYRLQKNQPYVTVQYKVADCMITVYNSHKVVFQGKEAEHHAAVFKLVPKIESQAGSDEVGTGDYFGPVCVCACIIEEKYLQQLPVELLHDSKQIKDEDILRLAPQLMKELPYSLLRLDNQKYNKVHQKHNMNQIKALLHNQAYLNLRKKVKSLPDKVIIDQFTPPTTYYRYLAQEENVVTGIHFETKAEDKYLAVACASIIARHGFLTALAEMSQHYKWQFPKGAGVTVDRKIADFVRRFGEEELKNVAKLHFKNTEKYKEYL